MSRGKLIATAAVVYWGLAGAVAQAQVPDPIIRVEEDWRVEISMPEPAEDAPQIVNVLSPLSTLGWTHAVFELNHGTLPNYREGGMQLQRWLGDDLMAYQNHTSSLLLHHADETITYTLSMEIKEGKLDFEVSNGQSQTWGTFGETGQLKHGMLTFLTNLDNYDPAVSVANARVGFASHRVKKFALKAVRYYSATGLVSTDGTEHIVHEHNASAE